MHAAAAACAPAASAGGAARRPSYAPRCFSRCALPAGASPRADARCAALPAPAGLSLAAQRRSPACVGARARRGASAARIGNNAAPPTAAARNARPLVPARVHTRRWRHGEHRSAALQGGPAEGGPVVVASAHRGEGQLLVGGAALLAVAVGYGVFTLGFDETMTAAKGALVSFSDVVRGLGPAGWVLYLAAYAGLEVVLLPATPLALTAGALFGLVPGTLLSCAAGLTGATSSFLLARYAFRDRVLAAAQDAPQFAAIDRAIGRDGFKVVLLVNLSPLSGLQNLLNYGYGVTSIPLQSYMAASGLALLPRTWAVVSAGTMGRSLLEGEEGGLALGAGLLVAVVATVYIAGVAQDALKEMDAEGEPGPGAKEATAERAKEEQRQ